MKKLLAAFILILQFVNSNALANTITIQATTPHLRNCIPFGCPGQFPGHTGFVYKNIPSFHLHSNDTIAFDVSAPNDVLLSYDIALSATDSNGSSIPFGAFTKIVSDGTPSGGGFGDGIVGNFDLVFTVSNEFVFAGGGLIIDFLPTRALITDITLDLNLVSGTSSDASAWFVGRYYRAPAAGASLTDLIRVGVFQIVTSPVPETDIWILMLLGLAFYIIRLRQLRKYLTISYTSVNPVAT